MLRFVYQDESFEFEYTPDKADVVEALAHFILTEDILWNANVYAKAELKLLDNIKRFLIEYDLTYQLARELKYYNLLKDYFKVKACKNEISNT